MKKSHNILILSVGRRVELVNCFRKAAIQTGTKSLIVGADVQSTAPALYFADRTCILPLISSPNYINSIIEACHRHDISLIVPTIDTDLMLLAESKEMIESLTHAKLLISAEHVVEICRDKILTQHYLEINGFKMPKKYEPEELMNPQNLNYPLFIKPKGGSSSINAFKVHNADELQTYQALIPDPLVQDFIEGEEFTVDTFLDFDSNIISIVPRLRLATRSGEISKGKIVKDKAVMDEVRRLLTELKPIGHITVQCMKTKRGVEFIEINPRFSGGAPMSIESGADSCQYLYKLLMGEKLDYSEDYQENLLFLRFDSCICLNENMEIAN